MIRHCQTGSPNSSPFGHNISSIVIIHIHYHIYRTLVKYRTRCFKHSIGNSHDDTGIKNLIYKWRHRSSERLSKLSKDWLQSPHFPISQEFSVFAVTRMIWGKRVKEKQMHSWPYPLKFRRPGLILKQVFPGQHLAA